MVNNYETARDKYRPAAIKCLLIAESPPDINSERFFYFEKYFSEGESLFMETMKALFPDESLSGFDYKMNKKKYLTKFKKAGLYLEDASTIPFPKKSRSSYKRKMLKSELPFLLKRLPKIITKKTPIVLITKPVFKVCYSPLKEAGFNILNVTGICFPMTKRQEFRTALLECVQMIKLKL